MSTFELLSHQVTARVLCKPFLYVVPGAWTCREACDRLTRPANYHNYFTFGIVDTHGSICGFYSTSQMDRAEDLLAQFRGESLSPINKTTGDQLHPLLEEMTARTATNSISANASYAECLRALKEKGEPIFVVDGPTVLGTLSTEECFEPAGASVFLNLILETEAAAMQLCLKNPTLFSTLSSGRQEGIVKRWLSLEGERIHERVRSQEDSDDEWTGEMTEEYMSSEIITRRKILCTMLVDRLNMAVHQLRKSERWEISKTKSESLINRINEVRNGLAHARVDTSGAPYDVFEQTIVEQIESKGSLYNRNDAQIEFEDDELVEDDEHFEYGLLFEDIQALHDRLQEELSLRDDI